MSNNKIAGKASFLLFKSLLFIISLFPLKMTYGFCSFLVFTGSRLSWKRKNIALDNIKIVFPEKSLNERRQIFRESLRNTLKSYFEVIHIINRRDPAKIITDMVTASGLEHLDKLKSSENGALLYSGHFGNFPLMIAWLAAKGYPIAAIFKEAENFPGSYFENMLKRMSIIPLKYKSDAALTVSVIKALKEKKIVLIQNDQSHPRGIYINFFNKYVPSPAGPALLAKRVGVPIIPAFIYRDRHNHHKIEVLPEIPLQQEENLEKFLTINTQKQIEWIAEILLKHPTEWLWLHNRWKRARKE